MPFQTNEIYRLLNAGKDSFSEFKQIEVKNRSVCSPNSKQIAGELVAFANADGGNIFFGVSDNGSILGISEQALDLVEQWIVNIATNSCDPPIRPFIQKMSVLDKDGLQRKIIIVSIRKGLYVHRTVGGRWLIRIGSTKRDLTSQEMGRLLQARRRAFVFDEQPVFDATIDALDEESLAHFFGKTFSIPSIELYRNTRVLSSDHPSVAGLLIFGKNPQRYLPSAKIEAAVFRGIELDSDALIHSLTIEGSADQQIDNAFAFVDRHMLRPARKSTGRVDYPQFSLGAVFEAIVNAVAHRDYSLSGAKIRLFMFDDRLELYSPGSLPNTLSIDTMLYRVFTRNQLFVSFLSRMKNKKLNRAYLESRGEGVRKILSKSEQLSGIKPEYKLLGEELLLTIWGQLSPHGLR